MAIKCNLSRLMGEKRYNIQQMSEKSGLSRKTISRLYHDDMQRIDFETLNKLCEAINCSVGEILEHEKIS